MCEWLVGLWHRTHCWIFRMFWNFIILCMMYQIYISDFPEDNFWKTINCNFANDYMIYFKLCFTSVWMKCNTLAEACKLAHTSEESFHSQDKRDNQLKKQKLKAAAWGKFTCRRSRDSKAIIGFTSWVIWWWLITPCMRHTSSLGIFQCLILAKKRND